MIDPTVIGSLSMRMLEKIEAEYGEEATLIRAMVVVEIEFPDPEDGDHTHTTVHWDSTENSRVAEAGLATVLLWGMEP